MSEELIELLSAGNDIWACSAVFTKADKVGGLDIRHLTSSRVSADGREATLGRYTEYAMEECKGMQLAMISVILVEAD